MNKFFERGRGVTRVGCRDRIRRSSAVMRTVLEDLGMSEELARIEGVAA